MITALLRGIVLFALLFFLFPAILLQGEGKLIEIKVSPAGDATEITMNGTDSLVYHDFYLGSPPRIVLDLPGTWNDLPQKNFPGLNIGGIRSIRSSQYKDDVTRVVLDVEKKMIYSVFPGKDNLRIVFRSSETGFKPWHSGSGDVNGEEISDDEEQLESEDIVWQEAEPEPKLITVDFQGADIQAVIRAFSEFSGKSIVAGRDVQGKVTAKITDMPWERAFIVLMKANGYGVDIQDGIYRVDRMENLRTEETLAMLTPTVFRLNYINPEDLAPTIESMLSERGKVQVEIKSNSIVVSDVPERIEIVREIIPQLDVKTGQVTIKSKLLFVNSVDLKQLGINWQATNMMDPTTDTHGKVTTGQSVTDPFLQLTYGTFKSGTNVTGMLEALEEQQLIDVQAQPQITTLDNLEAEVFVGEKTPIRVLDVGAQTNAAASVELIETGIKLVVTPHITNDNKVIMELKAERSSAVPVPTEFGVEFQTQEGRTTLLVDDGQTAVIGGLTTLDTINTKRGVPFLSKIPLIGYLFRYSSDKVEKKDLLIFVTPYIVS
jgi:type IV pilus assembly protein PilQ